MNQISEAIEKELNLVRYATKRYTASIKKDGQRFKAETNFVFYRTAEPLRYYDEEYQKSFMDVPDISP